MARGKSIRTTNSNYQIMMKKILLSAAILPMAVVAQIQTSAGVQYLQCQAKDMSGEFSDLSNTFSKILAPGYRLGWVCADGEILAKYNFLAQAASLQASTEAQLVVSKFIDMYDLDEHVAAIKDCYRKRRDVMMATMEREFPEEAKFTHPNGGLFTWVELPEYINTNEMAKECLKRNVAYVPGDGFFPDAGHNNCIRLNYSCMPEDKIEEGMTILGQVIKEYIKK